MYQSIFTDELSMDLEKALPHLKEWGLRHCDLRARIFQRPIEALSDEQLREARRMLDGAGIRVGCIQSSLAKVHLPGPERLAEEMRKLDGIIRASEILDCRLVRTFFFWQPEDWSDHGVGELAVRPDVLAKVMELYLPFAEKARKAGLVMAFENCGCTKEECFKMIEALEVPDWGFAWDPKNSWMRDKPERDRDFDGYLARLAARTICAHVKSTGSIWSDGGRFEMIPYDRIFAALTAAGFDGPVSIETHNCDPALNGVESSFRVLQAIRKAWPAAAAGSQNEHASLSAGSVTRPWAEDPVRFGVVGLGMGHNRALEIIGTSGVRLVQVCDRTPERAERTAEACGVPYCTDFARMLENPEIEAVMVMNETGRHAELACRALEAGKHVLVTKPMEMATAACDRMIGTAERCGRLLAVDFCRRLRPSVQSLRRAVERGFFGRVLSVSAALRVRRDMAYFESNGGWRGTRALDGGVLSNQAIHHLDEILHCFGAPVRVRCDARTLNHRIEMEDFALAVWEYADGMMVNIYATTCFPQETWYYRMEVFGESGAYIHREGGPESAPVTLWSGGRSWSAEPPFPAACEWLNSMDNFAAAIRTGASFLAPAEDGRRAVRAIGAMYESAYRHAGGWVEF